MATTTNFGWETPDDTDLVKDGAAAIRTALGGVDTSFVDLKGGTTGQVLSKASNTDLDYTWVTTDDANAIQNAIVDAKGDLIAATAADTPARLAVGANNTVLTADSSTATGLKWATPASGGMTLLSTTTLSGASVTISSIDQTYTNLLVVVYNMQNATANGIFKLEINSTGQSGNSVYASQTFAGTNPTNIIAGNCTSQEALDRTQPFNTYSLRIDNYASTSAYFKPIIFNGSGYNSTGHRANSIIGSTYTALYGVSSIKLSNAGGNFSDGTVLVYGVK